ncbi:MAG: amidohydrolase family protein [Candidatus Bathyarchaeia archaeon]
MTDILILNGTIVAKARGPVIRGGGLAIEGDRIAALGNAEKLRKEYKDADIVIDAEKKAVLPGIVNVHSHVGNIFGKGLTEDRENGFYRTALPLEKYVTPKDIYHLSLHGCVEALKFGVTCLNEIWHYIWETARAVAEIGMRGVMAHKVLETDLEGLHHGVWRRISGMGDERLKENIDLIKKWHGKAEGRITCRFGAHAPDTCSPELLKRIKELAQNYDVGINTHIGQSKIEMEHMKEVYGKGSVEFLDDIGFLGPDVVAAHLAWISKEEVEILRRTGTYMAHCPVIMAKRGAFPPMGDIYRSGVNVALGTDWLSMDPWDNMRCAIEVSRVLTSDVSTLSATRALELFTTASAEALGLEEDIGSLEIGKKADIIIIDLRRPQLNPLHDLIPNLVYYASMGDVETVIVDGKVILEDGRAKTVDEEEVVERAQEAAEGIWGNVSFDPLIV